MKDGWQIKPLADVCDVVNGGTPKTGVADYWGGRHLWITPAEMGKRLSPYVDDTERRLTDAGLQDSSARMMPPYSVIISSRAPIGHLVINTKPMSTNQGCKGLVPTTRLDPKFLYYYLSSIVDVLDRMGSVPWTRAWPGGKARARFCPATRAEPTSKKAKNQQASPLARGGPSTGGGREVDRRESAAHCPRRPFFRGQELPGYPPKWSRSWASNSP